MLGRFELGLPVIDLDIGGLPVTVILDTGFNGELLLPEKIIGNLTLQLIGTVPYLAVDGKLRSTSAYTGAVLLNNVLREVEIISTDSNFALAGMRLFKDSKITIEKRKELVLVE